MMADVIKLRYKHMFVVEAFVYKVLLGHVFFFGPLSLPVKIGAARSLRASERDEKRHRKPRQTEEADDGREQWPGALFIRHELS